MKKSLFGTRDDMVERGLIMVAMLLTLAMTAIAAFGIAAATLAVASPSFVFAPVATGAACLLAATAMHPS